MNKPNPDNLCVSRVALRESRKYHVINLCWSDRIKESFIEDEEERSLQNLRIMRQLERIPLMIACSIRAYNQDAPFKEEYVIPQLLLHSCIGSEYVDGIAFTSTKRDAQIATEVELHKNYVFPTQFVFDTGYCEKLTNAFCLTNGISFIEAEIKNVFRSRGAQHVKIKGEIIRVKNMDNGKSEYQCTKFGQMEEYLGRQSYYVLQQRNGVWEVTTESR